MGRVSDSIFPMRINSNGCFRSFFFQFVLLWFHDLRGRRFRLGSPAFRLFFPLAVRMNGALWPLNNTGTHKKIPGGIRNLRALLYALLYTLSINRMRFF